MKWIYMITLILYFIQGFNTLNHNVNNFPPYLDVKLISSTYFTEVSDETLLQYKKSFVNHQNKLCFKFFMFNQDEINEQLVDLLRFYQQNSHIDLLVGNFQLDLNGINSVLKMYSPLPQTTRLFFIVSNQEYIFEFTGQNGLDLNHLQIKTSDLLKPCSNAQNYWRKNFCGSLFSCELALLKPTNAQLLRFRREAVTSNNSLTNSSSTTSNGLSKGALAAAIVVPIIGVILLAVGGYFLFRWLHSRRSAHGKYKPDEMESKANAISGLDPHSVLKLPREERLI